MKKTLPVELTKEESELFRNVSRQPYMYKRTLDRLENMKKIVKYFVIKGKEKNVKSFHLNSNDKDLIKEVGSDSKVRYVIKFMFSCGVFSKNEEDVLKEVPFKCARYVLNTEKYKLVKKLHHKLRNINQKIFLGLVKRHITGFSFKPFAEQAEQFKKKTDPEFVQRRNEFLNRNYITIPSKPLENYKTDWEEYDRLEKEKPQPSTDYLMASLMSEIGVEQHNEKSVSEELANDIETE